MVAAGWYVLAAVLLDELLASAAAAVWGHAVFGFASVGLWAAGHHGWAVGLLVFSTVVNALAQLPAVRGLATAEPATPH